MTDEGLDDEDRIDYQETRAMVQAVWPREDARRERRAAIAAFVSRKSVIAKDDTENRVMNAFLGGLRGGDPQGHHKSRSSTADHRGSRSEVA